MMSGELTASQRLMMRRERIKRLHHSGFTVDEIVAIEWPHLNSFATPDLSAHSAQYLAGIEREVEEVIKENPLSHLVLEHKDKQNGQI